MEGGGGLGGVARIVYDGGGLGAAAHLGLG